MKIMIIIKKEIIAFETILPYFNCIKHPSQTNANRIYFIILQYYTQMYLNKKRIFMTMSLFITYKIFF